LKDYSVDKIRNIGLVSHGSVGKTSLGEAMLFSAGVTTRIGSIDEGTTVADYNTDEINRKISISSSLLNLDWKSHKINIVDMPGYTDFIGEVKGSLRAVDTAVILLSAQSGVEVGTELAFQIAKEYKLPRLFYITRLDKEHANFEKSLESAKANFGNSLAGENFNQIVDIIKMKLLTFSTDLSGKYTESDIPADLKAKAEKYHAALMETISENDESLLNIYCDVGELTHEQIMTGLRKQILEGSIFPVLCGSATKNIGVHSLMNFIIDALPDPSQRPPVVGVKPGTATAVTREPKADAPLAALVFKTVSEAHVGELTFFRIFSGSIRSGMEVLNANKKDTEKIGQIFAMNGKDRSEIGQMGVGDIGAFVKLKNTHTGDTLCDKKDPIQLPEIAFPDPVIRVAVKPRTKGDEEKVSTGLSVLHDEDPSFNVSIDSELKQIIVSGQGELHLDIVIKRLKEKFGVDVDLKEPKIPYRETIKGSAEGEYKHKKQSGGRGQYGHVHLRVEPLERGSGFEFVDAIVGGVIPGKYIPAVEKGVREVMEEGIIAGHKVVDVRVTLFFGSFHTVDSSDMAFKIAGSMCFKKVFMESKPILLEPIYDIEVQVPEEYMGDVMGDLSSRRGKIQGMEAEGSLQIIRAKAPLAELYKYSTALRSMTQGRGLHRRKLSHYEEVPHDVMEKIIADAQEEK